MNPRHRRSALGRVVVVCGLVAMALLWTDVGPELATWLYEALASGATIVEDEIGIDVVRRSDVPRNSLDTIGHVVLWFIGSSFVIWSARRLANPVLIAGACAAVSLASEWLQPLVSVGRVGEWSDALANLCGVLIALVLVGPSAAVRRSRSHQRHQA